MVFSKSLHPTRVDCSTICTRRTKDVLIGMHKRDNSIRSALNTLGYKVNKSASQRLPIRVGRPPGGTGPCFVIHRVVPTDAKDVEAVGTPRHNRRGTRKVSGTHQFPVGCRRPPGSTHPRFVIYSEVVTDSKDVEAVGTPRGNCRGTYNNPPESFPIRL